MKRTKQQVIDELEAKINRLENALADLSIDAKGCCILGDDLKKYLVKYRVMNK